MREQSGGGPALGADSFAATLQPDDHFGRILAACGGVFVAGSLAWGMLCRGFRPRRWDITALIVSISLEPTRTA